MKYKLIRGDYEVAKGVHLIETLGHSAGHYSLLVEFGGEGGATGGAARASPCSSPAMRP